MSQQRENNNNIRTESDRDNYGSNDMPDSILPNNDIFSDPMSVHTIDNDLGFSDPEADYIKAKIIDTQNSPPEQFDSLENSLTDHQNQHIFYSNLDNENKADNNNDTKKYKLLSKRLLFLCVAAFTAVTMIFINIISKEDDNKNSFIGKDAIEIVIDGNQQSTYIFDTAGNILHKIEHFTSVLGYIPDHAAALLVDPQGKPYFVSKNKLYPFTEDIISLNLSPNGFMVYAVSTEDGNQQVKLFDMAKETDQVLVDRKVKDEAQNYGNVTISPDGRTYSYAVNTMGNYNLTMESYISVNGEEPKLFGSDIYILALSNDGEYKYYLKTANQSVLECYVNKNGKEIFLDSSMDKRHFNKDYSELIFTNAMGNSYISSQGSSRIKLSDYAVLKLITPEKSIKTISYSGGFYPVKSFANKVLLCEDNSLLWIDSDYKVTVLGGTVAYNQNIYMSKDWNNIIYLNQEGSIVRIKDLKGNQQRETLASSCIDFTVTEDFKEIYYIKQVSSSNLSTPNYNVLSSTLKPTIGDLYYINDDKDVLLDKAVFGLEINTEGDTAFYTKDNAPGNPNLYSSSHGSMSSSPIKAFDHPIYSIRSMNYGTVVTVLSGNGLNLYYNIKGSDFKLILENVNPLSHTMEQLY